MNAPFTEALYVTGIKEVLWGVVLVAITLALHGFGMLLTLRASSAFKERFERTQSFTLGMCVIILASWMIIVVHLIEVFVWAGFFDWKGAVASSKANASLCYYFALMDYTTLGSNYNLKLDWRLLEGMIAIAGLLTFAWSTGVLMTLAQEFQDQQLQAYKQRQARRRAKPAAALSHPATPAQPS
jgi:hypothetical protein